MSDELEELRAATERGDRNDEDTAEDDQDFTDEIVAAIGAIDEGERGKTIAVRDQASAALLTALDENDGEMVDVGRALEDALDREQSGEFDRSEIVRLALRVGLQHAAPEKMDELSDAIGKHARENI